VLSNNRHAATDTQTADMLLSKQWRIQAFFYRGATSCGGSRNSAMGQFNTFLSICHVNFFVGGGAKLYSQTGWGAMAGWPPWIRHCLQMVLLLTLLIQWISSSTCRLFMETAIGTFLDLWRLRPATYNRPIHLR